MKVLEDDKAKIALWNTVKYVVIVVPVQTALALILAATLNAGLKAEKVFRIIYFYLHLHHRLY